MNLEDAVREVGLGDRATQQERCFCSAEVCETFLMLRVLP